MSEDDEGQSHRAALYRKYQAERDKRLVEGRSAIRDLRTDEAFADYLNDPFTPFVEREPVQAAADVTIVGAGLAGLVVAAQLRKAGIETIRLIDRAGGPGGAWYWNRYPGVMSDIESYVYLPMLEELGYTPTRKYTFGSEIRQHLESIADRFALRDDALFHTGVESTQWDESIGRWVLRTDRGDVLTSKYVVMAVGILNLLKLPLIPGMETFAGESFHTARWNYAYTGGTPQDPALVNLADKVVGVLGTGATAIQCVPPLAEHSKHLYVFQRTPSAIGERGNRPTGADVIRTMRPGWQRSRMDSFSGVMAGAAVEDLVDDGWTRDWRQVVSPRVTPGMSRHDIARQVEECDFAIMDAHRERVSTIVRDPDTAEMLKPYYRYACKRPCFHDEFLPTFNRPNVTLVSCPGGIERVTSEGLVVDGTLFELDCIVYATGFEPESTPFPQRAGHQITGRDGMTLAAKFAAGPRTLHGVMTRGFPNLFIMPAPFQQAAGSPNYTHVAVEGAEHIAATIAALHQRGVQVADVSAQAEQAWVDEIVSAFRDPSRFLAACTPSRINFEGDMSKITPLAGSYGGGAGDLFGWRDLLADWRRDGKFAGLELDERRSS